MMSENDITKTMVPIMTIYESPESGTLLLDIVSNVHLDPRMTACLMTLMFDTYINIMSEDKQIQAEEITLQYLNKMLEIRADYIYNLPKEK